MDPNIWYRGVKKIHDIICMFSGSLVKPVSVSVRASPGATEATALRTTLRRVTMTTVGSKSK